MSWENQIRERINESENQPSGSPKQRAEAARASFGLLIEQGVDPLEAAEIALNEELERTGQMTPEQKQQRNQVIEEATKGLLRTRPARKTSRRQRRSGRRTT